MSLINLDGTAIFGAGSEWFWSMAQFVLVAASIFGIYLQLRAQRASNLADASAGMLREWNDELFMATRLAALYDIEDRPVGSALPGSCSNVIDFFERIGYLVAEKHLRAADMWQTMRWYIGAWWVILMPHLEATRRDYPSALEWFEKLESEMQRLDRKAFGPNHTFTLGITMREAADDLARQLHLIADARNGIYPTGPSEPARSADA